jgi:hypothetical protein
VAAAGFAGAGECISLEDWRDRVRARMPASGGASPVHGARLRAGGDAPPLPPPSEFALHAAALPDVWHAAARVALASFCAVFADVDLAPAPGAGRGGSRPAAGGSRGGRGKLQPLLPATDLADQVPDSVIDAARAHLQTLVTCAALAERYGMRSGVDVVVAALCRVGFRSLRGVALEPAAAPPSGGAGGDTPAPAASGASASTSVASALAAAAAATSAAWEDEVLVLDSGGSGWGGAGGSGGGSGGAGRADAAAPRRTIFLTRQSSSAQMLPLGGSGGMGGVEPSPLRGGGSSLLSRSLSAVGVGAALGDDDGQGGPRSALDAAAAAFACDLRGQMALSAVLAIASPAAQGNALSAAGWRWIFECLLRLGRLGLVDLTGVGGAGGPQPRSRASSHVEGSGAVAGGGQPGGRVAGSGGRDDGAAMAGTDDDDANGSLRNLLAAYAVASARFVTAAAPPPSTACAPPRASPR